MAENSLLTARGRGPGRPFLPGMSGNRGGRPKAAVSVQALARERTEEAIETLAGIMRHGKTEAARVRAAEVLLARGWGQPTQPLDLEGKHDLIIRYVDDWRDGPPVAMGNPAPALPPGRDDD